MFSEGHTLPAPPRPVNVRKYRTAPQGFSRHTFVNIRQMRATSQQRTPSVSLRFSFSSNPLSFGVEKLLGFFDVEDLLLLASEKPSDARIQVVSPNFI